MQDKDPLCIIPCQFHYWALSLLWDASIMKAIMYNSIEFY